MDIHVLTIFPEMFPGVIDQSIVGNARAQGRLNVVLHDLRDHTADRHRSVDDRPFGGGPGMVFKPEPIFRAVEAIEREHAASDAASSRAPLQRILLTPQGERLSQPRVESLAESSGMILICGHYEGFDERIRIGLRPREVSVGDYVLSGGEVPALLIIDAVARLLPGVLGHEDSAAQDSFSNGMLDCPHYTRPVEFRGMRVPEVLRSGDHVAIDRWRQRRAIERTRDRRRDLLTGGHTINDTDKTTENTKTTSP